MKEVSRSNEPITAVVTWTASDQYSLALVQWLKLEDWL
jgi:hypothetical protein